MFKVNKKEACLFLGVCGPTTVINAGCYGGDVAWDKAGITKWLKGKVTLKNANNKDDNDKAIGELAENISKNEAVDTDKINAVNNLYKCTNDIDTYILQGDKGLVDAGKEPDKKKYDGKKAYHVEGKKDNNISITLEDIKKS